MPRYRGYCHAMTPFQKRIQRRIAALLRAPKPKSPTPQATLKARIEAATERARLNIAAGRPTFDGFTAYDVYLVPGVKKALRK